MADCATCARAKRKNRLIRKMADTLQAAIPLVEDNCSNAAAEGLVQLVAEARKEAER